MNFDTKYLIRWGIPGWIFIITISPYLLLVYENRISQIFNQVNELALGAAITLIGIPLGYFFNQLHHFFFWVINHRNWGKYFENEILLDLYLSKENNKGKHERYRYLLSKKHEVGSVLMSFLCSTAIIFIVNLNIENVNIFHWRYLATVGVLALIWIFLRQYSSKNAMKLYKSLLHIAKNSKEEN